jgi:hypothetical protein
MNQVIAKRIPNFISGSIENEEVLAISNVKCGGRVAQRHFGKDELRESPFLIPQSEESRDSHSSSFHEDSRSAFGQRALANRPQLHPIDVTRLPEITRLLVPFHFLSCFLTARSTVPKTAPATAATSVRPALLGTSCQNATRQPKTIAPSKIQSLALLSFMFTAMISRSLRWTELDAQTRGRS